MSVMKITEATEILSLTEDCTNPSYYKSSRLEVIDVIEEFGLDFCLGNAVKYILRAGKKGPAQNDLKKALWYLHRKLGEK